MKTCLYRHFSADGELLYIGISIDVASRIYAHSKSSHWFLDVARISLEHFESEVDAKIAERDAIIAESPRHNIKHAINEAGRKKSARPYTLTVTDEQIRLAKRIKEQARSTDEMVQIMRGSGIGWGTLMRFLKPDPVMSSTLLGVRAYFWKLDRAGA